MLIWVSESDICVEFDGALVNYIFSQGLLSYLHSKHFTETNIWVFLSGPESPL